MTAIGNTSLHWLHVGLTGSNAGLDVLKLENIESRDVVFSRHDDENEATAGGQGGIESYRGGWRDDQPEGEGRYTWPDGSTYEGSWMSGQKHGWGKYSWPNGASYLGEWKHGFLHGYGTFHSPDGSRYQGNWQNNLKDGIGTKWLANGDRHEGLYVQDKPHGPGRYLFASGDEFDGEFREGKFHGQGTFKWISKHRYDGEWWQGMKHGIGVFTWPDGSTYEGFWENGLQHGAGVFRPARRSTTTHGSASHAGVANVAATANAVLVGAPAAAAAAGAQMATTALHHLADPGALLKQSLHASGLTPPPPPPQPPHVRPGAGFSATTSPAATRPSSPTSAPTSPTTATANFTPENVHNNNNTTMSSINNHTATTGTAITAVYACEYRLGELILEEALQPEDLDYVFGTATRTRKNSGASDGVIHSRTGNNGPYTSTSAAAGTAGGGPGSGAWKLMARQSLVRRRRPKKEERMGETIYKGSPSFDLMLNLQLGIRYTLTTLSKLPPLTTPLEKAHFEEKVWLRFPRQGSEVTPPHPSNDFKWKDYSPIVFRQLRAVFGISNSEYILSTCGDHALRELPSPGKSGSVFFVSQDERFIIKTMKKEEVKLLLKTLPLYYAHVAAHPDTLISRFYGIHRITLASGRKVRFVVMNNIFATDMPLHRKYDLKGSTYKRTVGDINTAAASGSTSGTSTAGSSSVIILKDLDLTTAFQLKKPVVERLQKQLAADAEFLQAADVMDYSLLLGVHYRRGGGGGGGKSEHTNGNIENGTVYDDNSQMDQDHKLLESKNTTSTNDSRTISGARSDQVGATPRTKSPLSLNISSPEDSETELMTPRGGIDNGTAGIIDGTFGSNANMPSHIHSGDVAVPLVIHNSLSFSNKMAKNRFQQQEEEQMVQPGQQQGKQPTEQGQVNILSGVSGVGNSKGGKGINFSQISRFISWRRDIKEKKRQKAEQASGLGKVAMVLPPTPAPPLFLKQTINNQEHHHHHQQQQQYGREDVIPASPALSSSSSLAAAAPFIGHRRTTSATAALGSMYSTSPFSSPAVFQMGMETTSSPTAPTSPVESTVQRPGSGPVFRTASARGGTSTSAALTKNNKINKESNKNNNTHLRVTYSEQLIQQHAALVASLANWGVNNASTAAGAGETKTQNGIADDDDAKDTTFTPTKLNPSGITSIFNNDENTNAINSNTNILVNGEQVENMAQATNYRADAAALPLDSSIVEPTTPSSARVSNVFTRNFSITHTAGGGEVFITPFSMEKYPQQQPLDNATGATSTASPLKLHERLNEEQNNVTTTNIQDSMSRSYSEVIEGLSDDEAQAMISRLTTRLSKPIEERLAFDLLRLARHKMLGASSTGGGGNGTSASSRLPTAVLATARNARLQHSTSLDRKALVAAAAAGAIQQHLQDQMEPAESLSRYVPAITVPIDPTPGVLSAHTVPTNSTVDADSDQDVALFLGVIDWLQPYNARKRLEHGFKSVVLDSQAISVCEPRAYAKRFLKLMTRLFVAEPEPIADDDGS